MRWPTGPLSSCSFSLSDVVTSFSAHCDSTPGTRALPWPPPPQGLTTCCFFFWDYFHTVSPVSSEMSKPTCHQGRASCETLGPSTGGDQQSLAFLSLQLYHLNLFFCHNLGFSQCVSVFTWHFRYWSYWIRAHPDGLILTWLHLQRLSPNKLTFTGPKG